MHTTRVRRMGPKIPRPHATPRGEVQEYFHDVVLTYADDDCLIWPYFRKKDGRGMMALGDSRPKLVHREACIRRNGPPPTPAHDASHSCGNGHLGCVNPCHLVWKTALENRADTRVHGTWGWKLKEVDVVEIKRLEGVLTALELASQYDVHYTLIYQIWGGKIWKFVA